MPKHGRLVPIHNTQLCTAKMQENCLQLDRHRLVVMTEETFESGSWHELADDQPRREDVSLQSGVVLGFGAAFLDDLRLPMILNRPD